MLYENNPIPANGNPAAGIGNPLKYPMVGFTLNLANLKAPIVGKRINAKEVKIEGVAIEWNKSAGATPKLTISAKESNCTPNQLRNPIVHQTHCSLLISSQFFHQGDLKQLKRK